MDLRHERRRLLTLWLAVGVAPLAVVPGGFTRFVFAKLFLVALALAVGAYLRPQGRLPRGMVLAAVAVLAVLTVASLVGSTPVASLVGRWPRYEGLPVLGLYVAALWLGARVAGRGTARVVQVAHAVGAMVTVLAAVSVLEATGSSPLGPSTLDRPGALLGNASDQGLVAMMATIVVAGALAVHRDPFLLASLAAAITTVALSGSRIALALTAAGLLVVGGLAGRRLLAPAFGAVAALVAVAVAVPRTRDRLPDLTTGEARLHQWRLTLDLVADHAWWGVGPSRYVDVFGRYEDTDWVRFTGAQTLADSPHNIALQALVAGGVPLLAALVAAGVVTLRHARTAWSEHPECRAMLVAVGAYGAALLGNFTVAGPTCLAAFLLGAAVARPASGDEPVWRRHLVGGVGLAASLAMAAGCLSEIRLADGVEATVGGSTADAVLSFDGARSARPFDGDVAMLAAQAMVARADAGDPSAIAPGIDLSDESLLRTPDTYSSLLALGVARRTERDLDASVDALDRLVGCRLPARGLPAARAHAGGSRGCTRSAVGPGTRPRATWLDRRVPACPDHRVGDHEFDTVVGVRAGRRLGHHHLPGVVQQREHLLRREHQVDQRRVAQPGP